MLLFAVERAECFKYISSLALPSIPVVHEFKKNSSSISVQLLIPTDHFPDQNRTYGVRHLLEHFVAKNTESSLKKNLETSGLFLKAYTQRALIRFEILGNPSQIDLALGCIQKILDPISISQSSVDQEVKIIEKELSILEEIPSVNNIFWTRLIPKFSLDPFGSIESLKSISSNQLIRLHRYFFLNAQPLLSIISPYTDAVVEKKVEGLLKRFNSQKMAQPDLNPKKIALCSGSSLMFRITNTGKSTCAISLSGIKKEDDLCRLMLGFALSAQLPDARISFNPSHVESLFLIHFDSRILPKESLKYLELGLIDFAKKGHLFQSGKKMLLNWIQQETSLPSSASYLNGILNLSAPVCSIEMLLNKIEEINMSDFLQSISSLNVIKDS